VWVRVRERKGEWQISAAIEVLLRPEAKRTEEKHNTHAYNWKCSSSDLIYEA